MDSYELILADIDNAYQLHNYYSQDQAEFKKEKVQKKTVDHISEFDKNTIQQLQNEVFQKSVCIIDSEIQKFGSKNKTINRILVNPKKRKKYLQVKTGKMSKTNDLSVNVGTLFKSTFDQFQTFFIPHQMESNKLQQFKNSKSNIKSLRNLLEQNIQGSPRKTAQKDQLNGLNISPSKKNTFRYFIVEYTEQSYFVRQILMSKKMSFTKKMMLIKIFSAINESCRNPEKLLKWKALLMSQKINQSIQSQR